MWVPRCALSATTFLGMSWQALKMISFLIWEETSLHMWQGDESSIGVIL
jgi:hypothetical protein